MAGRVGGGGPVEVVVVVQGGVDQLQGGAGAVGLDGPGVDVEEGDGVDGGGGGVPEGDGLAGVGQVAAVDGGRGEAVGGLELGGVLGDDEEAAGGDGGAGGQGQGDAAERPAGEVDGGGAAVGELEVVVAVEVGEGVEHHLVDDDVGGCCGGRWCGGHRDQSALRVAVVASSPTSFDRCELMAFPRVLWDHLVTRR